MTSYPQSSESFSKLRQCALDDLKELEGLYLLLRGEIDRRIDREARDDDFDPVVRRLIALATEVLLARVELQVALGRA